MQLQSLVGALLFAWPALAAPAPRSKNAPSTGNLGTLQTLHYNNLGPQNNGTAAVLVYDRLTNSEAKARCAAIGENLYPLQGAPQANRTELDYQLDYLVYNHDIAQGDLIWVSGTKSKGNECLAYSQAGKEIKPAPCDQTLFSLCTSNVPPTIDTNRVATNGSQFSLAFDDYTLTGYRDARSFRFLGIPFADPPVGELRLAPPKPYSGHKTIDATKPGDSCIQSSSSFGTLGNGGISEDCLYLNIFTPVLPSPEARNTTRKPVAVYFYGGAFTKGSASMIDYDGGNLASRNDVIVVTVNYRVGALGWLTTGNLTTGSYGTRDQILALQWVNDHISAFGGDPAHITIFGQSAGGQSVVALLSSTAAKGLFSGAIVQSAPVDLPWFTREVYTSLITPTISSAIGCNSTSESSLVHCLRALPSSAFLDNSTALKPAISAAAKAVAAKYLHSSTLLASIEPFLPIIDDTNSGVIDAQFHSLLASGTLPNRVPTMFTTVSDEAALYVSQYLPNLGSSSTGALATLFNMSYPPQLASSLLSNNVFPLNASAKDSIRTTGASALTHSEWTCPQHHILTHGGATTFPQVYTLSITNGHIQTNISVPETCSPNNIHNSTCHAADVLPIFGTLNSKTKNVDPYYSTEDLLHSQLLDDIFGSFFRTRDPNPDVWGLGVRGGAYGYSRGVFGGGWKVPVWRGDQDVVAEAGWRPGFVEEPGVGEKCRVFGEFGYTFERAGFKV